MVDAILVQSGKNSGTVTPATPGSLTLTNHNLAVLVIAVVGTSPTIATPASWTQLQKVQLSGGAFAMYTFPNQPGGATNPSATLGGTVTGWQAAMFEFSQCGANCGVQGSLINSNVGNPTQLPNIFSGQIGQTISNLLFVYFIGHFSSTLTPQNSGLAPINGGESWSADVQGGVAQGTTIDTFWGSNLAKGVGSWPNCQGVLSISEYSCQIVAWFNTTASQPSSGEGCIISGNAGINNSGYQGMIGG